MSDIEKVVGTQRGSGILSTTIFMVKTLFIKHTERESSTHQ